MARAGARPRRLVGGRALTMARALGFRHDPSRDAYILRGVGDRFGPVLRDKSAPPRLPLDMRSGRDRRRASVPVLHDRRVSDRRTLVW